jgi:hypothetical protein
MLAAAVDEALAAPAEWDEPTVRRTRRWPLWVALVLLILVGVSPLLRFLAG